MSYIKQALVVYSAISGNADNLDVALGYIVRRLCEEGNYIVNVRPLESKLSARELLAPELGEIDLVVAVGGDGTVSTILGAMAELESQIPVGIVPCGTGNLLAKSLGILVEEREPISSSLDVILKGHKFAIDLGKMNGSYFVLDVGIGPISNAVLAPTPGVKRTWKMLSYVVPLLKSMGKRAIVCRFTIEGESFYRTAAGVFVTNAHEMGIGKGIDAHQFSDGLLDLVILNPLSLMDYLKIAYRFGAWFLLGVLAGPTPYIVKSVRKVQIETHTPTRVMLDGDRRGSTPIEIEVAPKAVHLMVPSSVALAAIRDEILSQLEAA